MELKLKYWHGYGWQSSWVVNQRVIRTSQAFTTGPLDCYNEAVIWASRDGPKTLQLAVMAQPRKDIDNE